MMNTHTGTCSCETKVLQVAQCYVRKDWTWRIFVDDETGFFHLYNLAKLEAFGFEAKETDYDPGYPDRCYELRGRHEWLESLGLRQASEPSFMYVPDRSDDPEAFELWMQCKIWVTKPVTVRVHCADDDDRSETEDIVVTFQDDGEDARYYEETGYWTIAPVGGSEERSLYDLLSPLSDDVTNLCRVTQPMALQIDSIHAILQSQSGARSAELPVGSEDATTADSISRIREAMGGLEILDTKGTVDAKDAVKILNHFKIKIGVHRFKNVWIKDGRIAHEKPQRKHKIPLTALAEVIENGDALPKGTYKSHYTPDEKKKPLKYR